MRDLLYLIKFLLHIKFKLYLENIKNLFKFKSILKRNKEKILKERFLTFKEDDRVFHKDHKFGTVLWIKYEGDNRIVKVLFDNIVNSFESRFSIAYFIKEPDNYRYYTRPIPEEDFLKSPFIKVPDHIIEKFPNQVNRVEND